MRTIRIDLEYDGRNYVGWQCQRNGTSIEETVKTTLEGILCHPVTIDSSGRTDAGVHAEQHVIRIRSQSSLEPWSIMRGMNARLPSDIAVYRVMDMPDGWSARRDAIEREYCYRFWVGSAPSVLWGHRCHWLYRKPDFAAMQTAARHLEGRHDFTSFRSIHCSADHPVRTILQIQIVYEEPILALRIRGQAFLRHQVRIIAGTLLEVGQGRHHPDWVAEVLDAKNRDCAGKTISAQGLTLVAVRYPDDEPRGVARYRYPQPGGSRINGQSG